MSAWQAKFSPLRHRDQQPKQQLSIFFALSEHLCKEYVVNSELEALVSDFLPGLPVFLKSVQHSAIRKKLHTSQCTDGV